MIHRIKWTDRKFDFSQPASLFPLTLERLHGTSIRLNHIVGSLPKEMLSRKDGDAWSIQEHVGHLIDLEELHEGRIDDFIQGKETLRPADMENKKTYAANHNSTDIQHLLKTFEETRAHYIKRLESLDEATLTHPALHPRLKVPMRLVDMALFTAEHDDQHLAIIRDLINKWIK